MSLNDRLERIVSVTAQMRLDLSATFEENRKTPVYFKNEELMWTFIARNRFLVRPIRDLKHTEALYIVAGAGSLYPYGLVWASSTLEQKKVRTALVNTIVDFYNISDSELGMVHADHLFNKASVKKVPASWLLIFPTIAEVNYKSGFRLERGLRVDPSVDEVELTPLHFFKMLSNFWPKSAEEFEKGMKIIAGQNLVPGMDHLIRECVGATFSFPDVD